MTRNVLETVFVAWGGNQPLAQAVAQKLDERQFNAIVGGGQQTDLFIGTQVLSQIHRCTRAILLVEDEGGTRTASGYNFSDNLMFEWGYITGMFQASKVHVFLINIAARDLPSDLAGSWASEVNFDGEDLEQTATQIANTFATDASHHIEIDKLEIMHMWTKILHYVEAYNETPLCSDIELAHYLVHSIETCYYYMDEERFEEVVTAMHPVSSVLEHAVALVKANIRLFRETNGLQTPLPFDTFMELKAFFDQPYDISFQDEELDLWFKFFAIRRSALLLRMVADNPEFSEDDRKVFLLQTVEKTQNSLGALDSIVSHYPQQASYSNMYQGYLHRDLYLLYLALGETGKAPEENSLAVKAKESFYLDYKARYPQDALLIQRLEQEYYLALAEHLDYVSDPIEKMMIRTTINSFLSKLEKDSGRQHVLLKELRAHFE